MRLIDADRLKSYIDCGHLRPPTEVCFSELDVCSMIDKAPTVTDAVSLTGTMKYLTKPHNYCEVVRCKDCRYFKKIAERSDSGLCHRDIIASAWKENGYCSRGERREP